MSHLIREEALPVWYGSNTFEYWAVDCDAGLKIKFSEHVDRLGFQDMVQFTGIIFGKSNWGNLKTWSKAVWCDKVGEVAKSERSSGLSRVVSAAHDIALHYGRFPWSEREEALVLAPLDLLKVAVGCGMGRVSAGKGSRKVPLLLPYYAALALAQH